MQNQVVLLERVLYTRHKGHLKTNFLEIGIQRHIVTRKKCINLLIYSNITNFSSLFVPFRCHVKFIYINLDILDRQNTKIYWYLS